MDRPVTGVVLQAIVSTTISDGNGGRACGCRTPFTLGCHRASPPEADALSRPPALCSPPSCNHSSLLVDRFPLACFDKLCMLSRCSAGKQQSRAICLLFGCSSPASSIPLVRCNQCLCFCRLSCTQPATIGVRGFSKQASSNLLVRSLETSACPLPKQKQLLQKAQCGQTYVHLRRGQECEKSVVPHTTTWRSKLETHMNDLIWSTDHSQVMCT